jgi:hypothetical protein
MRRAAVASMATLLVTGLGAGGAFGATTSTWQAVGGHFKTKAAASKEITKLSGKGFSGFSMETEKSGQFSSGKKFEVEKSFKTQKLAKTEVSKLHKAGFKGAAVENEKSEKATG